MPRRTRSQLTTQSGPPRYNGFNRARLAKELRETWAKEHPNCDSRVTRGFSALSSHIDRARGFELPSHIDPDSIVVTAFKRYLDIREGMTAEKTDELGASTPSEASAQLVYAELTPEGADTSPQELTDVSWGINIAKIALKRTIHP